MEDDIDKSEAEASENLAKMQGEEKEKKLRNKFLKERGLKEDYDRWLDEQI